MVTVWLVTWLLFKRVIEPYAVVGPYAICEEDGLSVVQVIVALVLVMLLEATLEMMTLALVAATLFILIKLKKIRFEYIKDAFRKVIEKIKNVRFKPRQPPQNPYK